MLSKSDNELSNAPARICDQRKGFSASIMAVSAIAETIQKIYHIPRQIEMQINNLMAAAILCETALWAPDKTMKVIPAKLGIAVLKYSARQT